VLLIITRNFSPLLDVGCEVRTSDDDVSPSVIHDEPESVLICHRYASVPDVTLATTENVAAPDDAV
jgi:hypothetical protein